MLTLGPQTLTIAHDAVVDGVYRRGNVYIPKKAQVLKNRKIDTGTFLHKTKQGVVDTIMSVAPLSGLTATQGRGLETIGTLELRLYVTRQLNVTYAAGSIKKYSSIGGNIEDEESQSAIYQLIPPSFQMAFEEDAEALESAKANRE